MAEIERAGKKIALDEDGFLLNLDDWDEQVARDLAKREAVVDLDEEMMEVVRFMRHYYKKFHAFPILNYVCKNVHQPRNCVSQEFINPMKAWKIAGLPKLDGIHFVAVDEKRQHYILEECC